MFSKVFCCDYILLQIGANFLIFFSIFGLFLNLCTVCSRIVHRFAETQVQNIAETQVQNILEFPQKAVVEAEGCPITLFEMDATHELDLEE